VAWILVAIGSLVGVAGMIVAVSSSAVGQLELYRWVSGRTTGARAARMLLAAPARAVGAGLGIAAIGCLVSGLAMRGALQGMPLPLVSVAVPVVAIPLLLSLTFALPRAAGRRWAESVIRNAVPFVEKLAAILVPLAPQSSVPTESAEPTTLTSPESDHTSNTEEFKVVSGVLTFAEQHVREVMTPRTDIVAVREGTLVDEVSSVFIESRYSRIPVYRDSLDNIVGMYYAFDLLKLEPGTELTLRPVAMAPASKSSADLLFEMQRDRLHMAVVLDEYGGTAGIATLQDLLEELVQLTFHAVHRLDESEIAGADVLEVSGTAPADEIASRFGATLPGDAETVSGLLSRAAGRIPQTGERFVLAGLEFDILAATATRIERVVVRRGVTPAIHLAEGGLG